MGSSGGSGSGGGGVPSTGGTFTGEVIAPDFKASGLTGAVSASRYVGATASGAPVTGTFVVGDFIVTQAGAVWVCTTAGSPGTWKPIGGRILDESHADAGPLNSTAETTLASLTLPAGISATGDHLRLIAGGDAMNNTGGAVVPTIRFKIGATTVLTSSGTSMSTNASRRKWSMEMDIFMESTSAQRVEATGMISTAAAGSFPFNTATISGAGYGTAAEATSGALALVLSAQLDVANAAADFICHVSALEFVRKPA